MSSTIRIAGALLAPLALGACGLPIGVQIASLFADGVSYLTTDKSLTDHGISAVTGEDCALWRGVEGEKICRNAGDKEAETIVAALGEPKRSGSKRAAAMRAGDSDLPAELTAGWNDTPAPATEPRVIAAAKPQPKPATLAMAPAQNDALILGADRPVPAKGAEPVRRIAAAAPAQTQARAPAPAPAKAPIAQVKLAEALPPPPPAPKLAAEAPKPLVAATMAPVRPKLEQASVKLPAKAPARTATAKPTPATYYVIASYRRAADADRFSKRNGKWQPRVIEGTAGGRQVFRVAVGPLDGQDGKAVKTRLKAAGFKDTWRLKLQQAPAETEVAAAR